MDDYQPAYEQLARIGKGVASGHRIHLLDLLSQGDKTVETLAQEAGLSVKNTSAHLRVLRGARLVDARKDGQFSVYRLADAAVATFVLALRRLAEDRLAEMREFTAHFLADRARLTAVDRRRLLRRLRAGEIVVLDVRASDEFEAGHIPGARSIPIGDLERALGTLPRSKEIVAYCRGPYCGLSERAVALLRRHGYRASRIHDGVIDWQDAGLPVERNPGHRTRKPTTRSISP